MQTCFLCFYELRFLHSLIDYYESFEFSIFVIMLVFMRTSKSIFWNFSAQRENIQCQIQSRTQFVLQVHPEKNWVGIFLLKLSRKLKHALTHFHIKLSWLTWEEIGSYGEWIKYSRDAQQFPSAVSRPNCVNNSKQSSCSICFILKQLNYPEFLN